ncbi:hypothetical protein ACQBAR_03320 [Propionibacteriaceae bacterium Y1685]
MHDDKALVEFARAQLPLVRGATAVAVCGLAAGALGLINFPSVGGRGIGWPVTAVVCVATMAVVCLIHTVGWQRAVRTWQVDPEAPLATLTRVSFVAHVISYVAVLLGMWATMTAMVRATFSSASGWLFAVALLALVAAQLLGGVRQLRRGGPAGTLPTHFRRLNALADRRRTE